MSNRLTVEEMPDEGIIRYKNLLDEEFNRRKLGATKTISEKDLETLQRYDMDPICAGMDEYMEGEYVRWDSLIQLLK